MFDYNSMMALKELVAGEYETEIVNNPYKGSMLNPASIGNNYLNKEIAKPNAKIEAKIGEKFIAKGKQTKRTYDTYSKYIHRVDPKNQIWSEYEVAELPIVKDDRRQPNFESMYRQRVGTYDVFLGLSGVDPLSNNCQEILYRIELPDTAMKDIQIDINEKQMVIQTNKYYLSQYFQYKMDCKKAKAKLITDKNILELVLPIIREYI